MLLTGDVRGGILNIFWLLTPATYWLLIVLWTFILVFYIRRLRKRQLESHLFFTLILILSIDAFRTLFESILFGAWYTSAAGLIPKSIHDFLVRPEIVFIPKIINVIAALLIITILIRRWLPQEGHEIELQQRQIAELKESIRKREKAEEKAKQVASEWETTFRSVKDMVSVHDVNCRYVRVNRAFAGFFNMTPEEVIGKTCYEVVHGSKAPPSGCPHRDVVKLKKPIVFETFEPRLGLYLEISASPILDENGEVVRTVHIMKDITHRKRIEKERESALDLLQRTIDGVDEPIMFIDTNYKIKLMNRVVRERYADTGGVVGEGPLFCYQVSHHRDVPCDGSGYPCPMSEVMEKHRAARTVHVHFEKNGEKKFIEIIATPMFSPDGRVEGIIESARDITDSKRMEEELFKSRKLESLGILAGGIAHDFNNLLGGILGNISLAKFNSKTGEKAYKYLEDTERAITQAKNLTQQLLTFSKGGAPIKKVSSIREIVVSSANFALSGSMVYVEYEIQDPSTGSGEPLWPVEVDPGQIGQVISNIVINADQAMPEGGTVKISIENKFLGRSHGMVKEGLLKKGKYVRISIEDHGGGIPKDRLSKIFDPYFTTKQKGSGLGLTTCYSIVKNHQGLITVESELGKGSVFHIYLPATDKPLLTEKEEDDLKRLISKPKPMTPKRVLVMDDMELMLKVAGEMLINLGYKVETVPDGEKAIELYREAMESRSPFDAVILDLTVPGGMGGKEAIEKLLQIDPDIKAIVSSGHADDPIMSEYEKFGFSGVVCKPYSLSELSSVLRKVME
jgi:PAS domain S-box-containing protein